jgi:hypothetical protein
MIRAGVASGHMSRSGQGGSVITRIARRQITSSVATIKTTGHTGPSATDGADGASISREESCRFLLLPRAAVRPARAAGPAAAAPDPRRWWILVVIAVAQLMIVLDATIMNIALP